MKVLVLGAGGREHAIITALLRDPAVTEVHAAPGNAGIARVVPVHRIDPASPEEVTALSEDLDADLVVVGPEAPLVAGVADALREAGIPVFGPDAAAARLESSKAFAKEVMAEAGVPTAEAAVARSLEEVRAAMDRFGAPYVIKDDGLAGGKGVVVTEDRDAAEAHAAGCFEAGSAVVVEEHLDGPEVSLFVLCDGVHTVPLSPAQDFKRIGDGDAGPNTGGMGAYTPLPWLPEGFTDEVVASVAQPVVDAMARRGTPFVGVLYCGLAVTARGVRVIEFNARFGDPETQAVLARLRTPLGQMLLNAAEGELDPDQKLRWDLRPAVDVVMAAENYPGSPRTGDEITGLTEAERLPDVTVLHAGTTERRDGAGRTGIVTDGGRVLAVVALGEDLADARARAYAGVEAISWPGEQHRTDIARRAAEGRITIPSP